MQKIHRKWSHAKNCRVAESIDVQYVVFCSFLANLMSPRCDKWEKQCATESNGDIGERVQCDSFLIISMCKDPIAPQVR